MNRIPVFYGSIAEVPVFDPRTPENAYISVKEAFLLSEKVKTPVIIRLTDRLLTGEGDFTRKNEAVPSKKINKKFDKNIWHLTMLGKHQRFHTESYPEMCKFSETSKLNSYEKKGDFGVISSGFPSVLVETILPADFSHLHLTIVNPLPVDLIDRFIREHSRVLIVEETEPLLKNNFQKECWKAHGTYAIRDCGIRGYPKSH